MNIALGRYLPYNTPIHRIDERTKILVFISIIVSLFLPYKTYTFDFLIMGIGLVFVTVLLIISKVKIHMIFSSLKSFWFIMILIFILQIFIPGSNNRNWPMWKPTSTNNFMIYWDSIFIAIKVLARLLIMMGLAIVLTTTSKPLNLTKAFEWYMYPLKVFKFPVSEVAMMISIALRFIPTLLDETIKLMKAQECRGLDFKHGGLKTKFKGIISLIIPLFVSTFKRSDELANAMVVRGYEPKAKRTSYSKLTFKYFDLIITVLSISILAFSIVVFNMPDVFQTPFFNDNWVVKNV